MARARAAFTIQAIKCVCVLHFDMLFVRFYRNRAHTHTFGTPQIVLRALTSPRFVLLYILQKDRYMSRILFWMSFQIFHALVFFFRHFAHYFMTWLGFATTIALLLTILPVFSSLFKVGVCLYLCLSLSVTPCFFHFGSFSPGSMSSNAVLQVNKQQQRPQRTFVDLASLK